eukprot:CAMPEP_0171526260 /NCGR_PEP_ID=MMETSP0959-20130129/10280_1 /TAXON_ID=87120 /ORGANISM="Aurantiochytrium limacinum, Strain ATCCMYA-1381" /LENGTH=106 /DNA_ID=CAMNT_0012067635 /DNA_START=63 /DNA_END=383 /DNA_ORIENTATION=+
MAFPGRLARPVAKIATGLLRKPQVSQRSSLLRTTQQQSGVFSKQTSTSFCFETADNSAARRRVFAAVTAAQNQVLTQVSASMPQFNVGSLSMLEQLMCSSAPIKDR